ncbi:hypothetical protein [Bernardetia litoralis]|nr:hypothetical protein [Bernardetia litoralis]
MYFVFNSGGVAQSMIFSKAFQSSKIIQLKTTSNAVVGVLAKRHQQHK